MNRNLSFLVAVLCLLLVAPAAIQAEGIPSKRFERTVERILKHWQAPGVVISVVKDGKVVFVGGFGTTKVEGGVPANGQTLTQVASITKSVTAVALSMLVDDGHIRWDDPLKKHIPEFEFGGSHLTGHITLRDVMMHRTGIPNDLGGPTPMEALTNLDYTMKDLLHDLQDQQPVIRFREGVSYSNVGIALLGEVIARVSEGSWAEFVNDRVLEPLGMDSSHPGPQVMARDLGQPNQIENLMKPVVREKGNVVDGPWVWWNPIYWPPAGVVTTAEDMAKFMFLMLNDGIAGERRLLSSESIRTMFTPHEVRASGVIADWVPIFLPRGKMLAFSPGWIVHEFEERLIFEHVGAGTGSTALALVPEEHLGVFVATNATYSPDSDRMVSALKFAAIEHFLGLPPTDWIALLDEDREPQ